MVKKLKVVDVAEGGTEPAPVEEQAPIVVEEEEAPTPIVPEEAPVPVPVLEEAPTQPEAPAQVEEAKPTKQPKKLEYITCETCNKNMLMKTYKYSHQKLCQNKNQPPPPLPPQPVVSKPQPKRAPKPQQKVEDTVETPKPVFNGTVSFNEFQPDPYIVMREQRVMMRQQRVKSLISQAI